MRFSLWLWPYERWGTLAALPDAAQLAEDLGFASVTVSDHVAPVRGAPGLTDFWPDWAVLSSLVAARTRSLRIVSCVVVPYRPALVTAKQVATLDVVSGGRFTLAAAAGWLGSEFGMLGVDARSRGPVTDEYLQAMRVLWTDDSPSYSGRHVSFGNITFAPRCVQVPHVPVWIAGGAGSQVFRRVVSVGDGWMPMGGPLDEKLVSDLRSLREMVLRAGRDPGTMTFRYTIGIGKANAELDALSAGITAGRSATIEPGEPEALAHEIERFERAGFNELAVNFSGRSPDELREQLCWFGSEVMPLCR
jgi:probable F420-dependent oxidoreductase